MRIALCSYSQKEKETALLMKLGKVDRFDNGVFCTYAMQWDGPYDAVVVMEDGARGMNFCMSIRGYSKDVPLLWISDQAEFEPQSRRMQDFNVENFDSIVGYNEFNELYKSLPWQYGGKK